MVGRKTSQKPTWQKKPPLTHFLCLPLLTEASQPQLDRSLKQFSNDVCSNATDDSGVRDDHTSTAATLKIHPKAVRPLGTLHLTLGVMSLNQDQLAKATELLSSLDIPALFKTTPGSQSDSSTDANQESAVPALSVDLKGLEPMQSPESTSILYAAPADSTGRLYDFCLALQKHFRDFLVSDDRPLRLHATIVNTIYAKSRKPTNRSSKSAASASEDRSQGHGPNAKGSHKMDARDILQRYQDYIWAEDVKLDRVAICEMGAKKIMNAAKVRVLDERYTEVSFAALPV